MDNQMWWGNQQQPIQQTPEQMEEMYMAQLGQIVQQDTMQVNQVFQQYQAQASMYAFYGMMPNVDPRMWHINHLFEFKHFLQGYSEIEAFLLSKGLTRFSQYVNAIRADINKALAIYGAPAADAPRISAIPTESFAPRPATPAPVATTPSTPAATNSGNSDYMEKILKIQKDVADHTMKIMNETHESTQKVYKEINDKWSKYLKS